MILRFGILFIVAGLFTTGWREANAARPHNGAASKIPAGGKLATAAWPTAARFNGVRTAVAKMEPTKVEGQPFISAVRITHEKQPRNLWDVQIQTPVAVALRKGDVGLLEFWARDSDDDGQAAEGIAHLQFSEPPHTKLATHRFRVGRQWKRFFAPFRIERRDYPAGHTAVAFHLGLPPQSVEIGGVKVWHFGDRAKLSDLPRTPIDYEGREPTAAWRKAAAERIEKHRKAELAVRVVDDRGRPAVGAKVRVQLTRHAFPFGAAVKARLLAMTDDEVKQLHGRSYTLADLKRYREIVDRHFNRVVFENDLKTGQWNLAKSNKHRSFRRAWTDKAFAWLAERKIDVRGHYLTWAPLGRSHQPRSEAHYRAHPGDLRRDLLAHIDDKAPAVGRRVVEWDAVNHVVGWGTTFSDISGGDKIYAEIIARGRERAPGVAMWINEGQILSGGERQVGYARIIERLKQLGSPADGAGMMAHFNENTLTSPEDIYRRLERFARLTPRLQLTELDVTTRDEQLQADYLRDVMTVAFSHPAVEGIVMWGFWEKAHWRPQAALWQADWSLKPAGKVWLDLVHREWSTDAAGQTDAAGVLRTRGFLGTYRITVEFGGKTATREVKLDKGGGQITVSLHSDG